MEREPGVAEQVPAAEQVGPVVDVAAVGRAAAGADDAGAPELGQVVRDQVLRLADELHELADAAIAAPELDDQLPAQRIAEQPEDLRRLVVLPCRILHQVRLMQCKSMDKTPGPAD